jgi:hypothetical protein
MDNHDIAELFGRDFNTDAVSDIGSGTSHANAEVRAAAADAADARVLVDCSDGDTDARDVSPASPIEQESPAPVKRSGAGRGGKAREGISGSSPDLAATTAVVASVAPPTAAEIARWMPSLAIDAAPLDVGQAEALVCDYSANAKASVVLWLLLGKTSYACKGHRGPGVTQQRLAAMVGKHKNSLQYARQAWEHVLDVHGGVVPTEWFTMSRRAIRKLVRNARRAAKATPVVKRTTVDDLLRHADKVRATPEDLLAVVDALRERQAGRTVAVAAVTGDAAALMAVVRVLNAVEAGGNAAGPPEVRNSTPVDEIFAAVARRIVCDDEPLSLAVIQHPTVTVGQPSSLAILEPAQDAYAMVCSGAATFAAHRPFQPLTTDVSSIPMTRATMLKVALSTTDITERPPLLVAEEAFLVDRLVEMLSLAWSSTEMGFQTDLSRKDIVRLDASTGVKEVERWCRDSAAMGTTAKRGIIVTSVHRSTARVQAVLRERILHPDRQVPLLFTASTLRGIDPDFRDACRVIEVDRVPRDEIVSWLHGHLAPHGASRAEVAAMFDHNDGRLQPTLQMCNDYAVLRGLQAEGPLILG